MTDIVNLDLDGITAWESLHYRVTTGGDLLLEIADIVAKRERLMALSATDKAVVLWLARRSAGERLLSLAEVALSVPLFPPDDEPPSGGEPDAPEPAPVPVPDAPAPVAAAADSGQG